MLFCYVNSLMINVKVNGDWGLGIGDCPIPNPQSPSYFNYLIKLIILIEIYII